MTLDELTANELSDDSLQWAYDLIQEAYDKGESSVEVHTSRLTDRQFNFLRDVKGFTLSHHSCSDWDVISGW